MRLKRLVVAVIICTLSIMSSYSQTSLARTSIAKGKIYAIIIGISNYMDENIKDLKFAHKDAKIFADYLTSKAGGSVPSDHIKLLTEDRATSASIYAAIDETFQKVTANDLVYFYFSGHGDVEGGLYKLGFLLAYNTPFKNYYTNAVRIEDINRMANTMSVEKNVSVILITDACHSGKLVGSDNRGTALAGEQLSKAEKNEIRLASCEPEQKSQEGEVWGGGRGVFSYYLINGLQGLADMPDREGVDDGIITLLELKLYLAQKVPSDVASINSEEQIPVASGKDLTPIAIVNDSILGVVKKNPPKINSNTFSDSRSLDISSKSVGFVQSASDHYIDRLSHVKLIDKINFSDWKTKNADEIVRLTLEKFPFKDDAIISKSIWINTVREDNALKSEFKKRLAAVIHDNVQVIINEYMVMDVDQLQNRSYNEKKDGNLDKCPDMLETALKLEDGRDYMSQVMQIKSHYTKGLSARLRIPISSNPDSLRAIASKEQSLALAIDSKVSYAHYEAKFLEEYSQTNTNFKTTTKKTRKRIVVPRN